MYSALKSQKQVVGRTTRAFCRAAAVLEGQPKIARRFNAGFEVITASSPEGTIEPLFPSRLHQGVPSYSKPFQAIFEKKKIVYFL